MYNELNQVKQVIATWAYNTLNEQFPDYFNSNDYYDVQNVVHINSPNVYWANTQQDRPLDATLCTLNVVRDDSYTFGTDGKFIPDSNINGHYEGIEPHFLTVRFAVVSMKNKALNLSALQAQNLSYSACSYLRTILKSGSASYYFQSENEIAGSPILVCSQAGNITEVLDISTFEDTKNKYTHQFSCVFRYDLKVTRQESLAQSINGVVTPNNDSGLAQDFEVHLESD